MNTSRAGLLQTINMWQEEARHIPLAVGSSCKPAQGDLPGPAFFPEGYGLSQTAMRKGVPPTLIAVGHNFGCEEYRKELGGEGRGREDNIVGTWRSLDRLLNQAGIDPDLCFRTNWFIGLRAGDDNDGSFLTETDEDYEQACSRLLLKQINYLQPHVILLLGPIVANRSYRIAAELNRWQFPLKKAITFKDIDAEGHTVRNVLIRGSNHRSNVVALLHPSKGWLNEPKRKKRIGLSERDLIRNALS